MPLNVTTSLAYGALFQIAIDNMLYRIAHNSNTGVDLAFDANTGALLSRQLGGIGLANNDASTFILGGQAMQILGSGDVVDLNNNILGTATPLNDRATEAFQRSEDADAGNVPAGRTVVEDPKKDDKPAEAAKKDDKPAEAAKPAEPKKADPPPPPAPKNITNELAAGHLYDITMNGETYRIGHNSNTGMDIVTKVGTSQVRRQAGGISLTDPEASTFMFGGQAIRIKDDGNVYDTNGNVLGTAVKHR